MTKAQNLHTWGEPQTLETDPDPVQIQSAKNPPQEDQEVFLKGLARVAQEMPQNRQKGVRRTIPPQSQKRAVTGQETALHGGYDAGQDLEDIEVGKVSFSPFVFWMI